MHDISRENWIKLLIYEQLSTQHIYKTRRSKQKGNIDRCKDWDATILTITNLLVVTRDVLIVFATAKEIVYTYPWWMSWQPSSHSRPVHAHEQTDTNHDHAIDEWRRTIDDFRVHAAIYPQIIVYRLFAFRSNILLLFYFLPFSILSGFLRFF